MLKGATNLTFRTKGYSASKGPRGGIIETKAKGRKPFTIRFKSGAMAYVDFYRADPMTRIEIIKEGVAATEAKLLIHDLGYPQGSVLSALNVSPATINRRAKNAQRLSPDDSERVLGVAKLIGQVQDMIGDAGGDGFDPAAWVARWLDEPLPALGGARPLDMMGTMEGQALVSRTLDQIQSGAYA